MSQQEIIRPLGDQPKVTCKVLTQKDKWFSGKFDPLRLEEALNAYSNQGWRVRSGTTASFPSFGGFRDEMIVILEREERPSQMFEYKVLSQKDKWFSAKFDPNSIEQAINAYAAQGWRVSYATTASIPSFGGNREEMIIIMERAKSR